jgi:serine/threonine protein kinase
MKIIDIKKENEIFNKKKDISCSENKDKDKDKIYSLKSNSSKDQFQDLIETQKYLSTYCKEFNEKFELLELIKSGSAGAVFRGHLRNNTRQNSKQIAFKFLFDNNREYHDIKNKEKKTNEKSRKKDKFQHMEISIHGMLKYKHIPEIYGYYKIENSSCIAMEFNKYGDLENFKKKVLKRASLSETLVLYIAGGIIEALNYIHTNNKIIHMDIKQQNVLIDDFLTVKLTDFSVSINYKKIKEYIDLPMVGTCYYMSPEVLNKRRISVNEASKIDIYSLGVLLYLLAFYDYPYNLNDVGSKDYAQIAKNIAQKELEFPQDTGHSKLFINFLRNCLNKDIKKRYDIHQVMKDPWFKGYSIILNEKEKLYNAGKFIIDLMVDNLLTFNNYLKEQESLL